MKLEIFDGLINITHLNFSHNKITTLYDNVANLGKLELLDMSYNLLGTLPNTFTKMTLPLASLKFDNNCIDPLSLSAALTDFVNLNHVTETDWKTQSPSCPVKYNCANIKDIPMRECEALKKFYNTNN